MPTSDRETFSWRECADALRPYAESRDLLVERKRRFFEAPELRVHPPLVLPIPEDCVRLADYLATLPDVPGRHVVILMQAGATALGLFEGGEERATKSFQRYVVRGKGRAQPKHLDTKGKSRYGSRLRLQNAQRLVDETAAKLREWWEDPGPPEHVFTSVPVRLWPTLFDAKPPPPFDKGLERIRIPHDLPKPTTEVLRRTYRKLEYGWVERTR